MPEVNNPNTESISCMYSKITIKTPKWPQMFLLLTSNKFSRSKRAVILQVYLQL